MFATPEGSSPRIAWAGRAAASLMVDLMLFLAAAGAVSGAACSGVKSCGASAAAAQPVAVGPTAAGGR
ncbi:MAG TPA: hypothetical protein VEU33_28940 [Archangium sp.]|nr:hypothetical protein [Archangium sp.]